MTNILKLRQGRSISKADYAKAKSEFDDFYQSADADTRAKLDGLLQSSLNYSSADPMNNRSAREYATQIYKNAVKIGKGEYAEAPNAVASTKNIFNGYSHSENIGNANYVTSRYLGNIGYSNNKLSTQPSTQGLYHEYNWAKGLDSGWGLETDTLEDRMGSFAKALKLNLLEAQNAKASGKDLIGISENKISQALAFLNKESWTKDDFKSLMNAAQTAGVDPSVFKNYFGDLFPGVSAEEKAKKVWTDKGYNEVDPSGLSEGIKSALNSNNVRLLKDKDNNYTLAGKDWSEYSGNGFNWIDLNQGDTYGHGILVGTDGKVFLGNTADINDSHWANKLFSGIKNEMYELYNPIYTRKNFNLANDYSEENLINEYIHGLESAGYKNPDASYTDVSKLFNGTSKVIAYNPNGTELGTGTFGELILSPDTQFMWENADGSFGKGTLEDAKQKLGGFSLKGYDTEANEQLGALSDLSNVFEGAEGLSGDTKLSKNDFKKGLIGSAAMGIIPYGLYRLFANDTIGNKPQVFVDLAVQALKNPQKKLDVPGRIMDITGSEFLAQFGTRSQLLETIGRFVNEGAKLNPQDLRWIKNMYYTAEKSRLDSEAKTRKHKEGGILYAADGTALFVNQERPTNNWHEKYDKSAALKKEDADITKALQEGYKSAEHYRVNKNTDHLSTADMMRIGTIAADVTSIIASFTSGTGVGAAVAEGAGLTAFGIDTAADIIDPSVSSGEVLKNGLINAGLAAVSFIPGARIPATLGKVIKYAPKVLLAASAMGIAMDDSVQNTFKKVTEGKEKLNTEDWRNIAHVFTLVAAGSRAGRQGYEKFRAKKNLTGEAKNVLTVKSGDANIAEIPADKKPELDAIKKLAKEGNIEEAQGKLAALLGKTADEVKGFFSENSSVASKVRGKYSLDLKTSEQKAKVDIDKALEAFENAKYSSNSTWSWLRNAPTWRLRGIMDVTEIYPTGIVGNLNTEGVSKSMRAKILPNKKQTRKRSTKKANRDWIWDPSLSDQEYYKDGGKVNYQKLRK